MTTRNEERLDAIRRELERQNEEWERIKDAVARLGDVEIAVPREVLAQLVEPATETAAPVVGVRA